MHIDAIEVDKNEKERKKKKINEDKKFHRKHENGQEKN